MNTRSIASNLVALSLGAILTACGGAEMNDASQLSSEDFAGDEVSNFDAVDQEVTVCDDNQYDHWRYLSALAVAAGKELGRWNAPVDFVKESTYVNPRILLSSTGQARCNPTGCPNVTAILQLQNTDTSTIPRHDPLLLRQYMATYFDRQKNNNLNNPAPNHALVFKSTAPDVCGDRYFFDATGGTVTTTTVSGTSEFKATSAYKCMDIAGNSANDGAQVQQYNCNGGTNQKFTVEANGAYFRLKANNSGKCLGVVNSATNDGALLEQRSCGANNSQNFTLNSKGTGLYELKNVSSGKCVDIQGGTADGQKAQLYSCHGGANQTFQATGLTATTSTSTASITPSTLWSQLKFAGETDNKYLMFQSTATQVSIDPMGTLVDGGSGSSSGSCYAGSTVFNTTTNLIGACCTVNGVYGTLARSAWNVNTYVCRI